MRLRRLLAAAGASSLALLVAGCSFSYQLDTLFTKADVLAGSPLSVAGKGASDPPAEGDLAIARAAVSEVLANGGKNTSMPWENPSTGARGTVTPLASVYSHDGTTCRDFLASYVRNGNESWMQGEACRGERGSWEVRRLRPWKET